jgi:hypothetical protein
MPGGRGPGGASKKGRSAGRTTGGGPATSSGRYTAPIPRNVRKSPKWMGVAILAFLIVGGLIIILNYFKALPASPTNWDLLAGIGLIAGGFGFATRYH